MRRIRNGPFIAAIAMVAAACGGPRVPMDVQATAVEVDLGFHVTGVAAWRDDMSVIGFRPDDAADEGAVLAVGEHQADPPRVLDLPQVGECRVTDYLWPTVLDGRVAAVRSSRPSQCGPDAIVVLDPETNQVETLVEVGESVAAYAWVPDEQLAIVESGSALCAGLGVVQPGDLSVRPMSLEIVGGSAAFQMEAAWQSRAGDGCEEAGWARWPTVTASRLAFVASTAAVGLSGPDRALAPAQIYVVDVSDAVAEPTGPQIVEPRGLSWSPDGSWLAVAGTIDGSEGLWIYDPADDRLLQVVDQTAVWHSWKRDGSGIVAVMRADPDDPLSDAVLVDYAWSDIPAR